MMKTNTEVKMNVTVEDLATMRSIELELPMDAYELESMLEKFDEFIITDIESNVSGLQWDEYMDIATLNETTTVLSEIDSNDLVAINVFMENGEYLEDILNQMKNGEYRIWFGCDDMTDVARMYVKETGMLDDVGDIVEMYFDYESYGRDMEIEGRFYRGKDGNYYELYAC